MNRAENLTKKTYVRLSISPVRVEIESSILTGSVTECKISVSTVEVQEYFDGGTFDITF